MIPLPKLQQEAREEFKTKFVEYHDDYRPYLITYKDTESNAAEDVFSFLDSLTARVYAAALDSVESGMPEQELLPLHCSDTTFAFGRGRNDMRTQLLSHLRTLREGITGNEHAK